MPEIMDEPPVVKIDPATIKTATPVASKVVDPAAIAAKVEPQKDKSIFNDMASKLAEALKAKPDVVKPTETKETKTDEKEIKDPKDQENISRKSEDWRKLHSRVKEVEAKSENLGKELQAKVAEIETLKKQTIIDPKELETLKTEKNDLLSQLERVALSESPAFKNYFEKKFGKATAMAKDAVGSDNADAIEHLMAMPQSKQRKEALSAILENMPTEVDRLNLARAVQDMDDARAERTEQLSKSKENMARLTEAQKAEHTKQTNAHKARISEKIDAVLTLKNHFASFTPIDGDDRHNAAIPGREAAVRKALSGELPENELAVMPLLAEEAVYLKTSTIPALEAKIKSLEESITKLSGAQPGVGHGEPTKVNGKPKTVAEIFNENYVGPHRRTT